MEINFAKLNHILLPDTKAGRDRFRQGLAGKLLSPFGWLYGALTDEGRALLVGSTVIGFFGLDVQLSQVFILWSAVVGLLLGSLVVRLFFGLGAVFVKVVAPRRVTAGEPVTFTVVLRNDGPRDHLAVRIRGPFLPWDGGWTGRPASVPKLASGAEEVAEVTARFVARGEHHLDPFGASALVPLGLALGRAAWSPGVKFLVVPRIADVVRLSLPGARRHQPGGVALASRTGESMDLLGVRPYRPGDPVKHLHARSWARAGVPVVREYQEEYFTRIGVVVDTAPRGERLFEAVISLAAGVVAFLSRGEVLVDLLVVGGELHDVTIGRHLGFLDQALDLLAVATPAKKPPAAEDYLSRLAPHLARLSSIVVVTARPDPSLTDGIQSRGVSVTTLVVTLGDRRAPVPEGPGVIAVDAGAVERGEPLAL